MVLYAAELYCDFTGGIDITISIAEMLGIKLKENFDRLLKVVQDTAKEQSFKYNGQVQEVLVENVNDHDESLMTGRMSNNTLVHFPGDRELIGKMVKVKITECHGFYFFGEIAE